MDYKSPTVDILFALEHGAAASRLADWDAELAREIVGQSARFVDNEVAPLEPLADQSPPRMVDGRIKIEPKVVAAVKALYAGGWVGLSMPTELGGQGLPRVLTTALLEMIAGASLNFMMLISCPEAAMALVLNQGSEKQKKHYVPGLANGEFSSTIVLSEPQAGSDLSLMQTKAQQDADGNWSISGNKVFISNADHDLTANIVHCILARVPDAGGGGLKDLTLFLCPAVLEDGSRNNIHISRIEEKLGIHVTPTCQVSFEGAKAEIVGEPGQGLTRMFTMMNAMRLDVAAQGTGMCEIATQRSWVYAAERQQGRSSVPKSGDGRAVAINRHGDIRRQLLTQRAYAEGTRAMLYRTAVDLELGHNPALVDLMTAVCKVLASDAAVESANMAIQIHGGYGFIREYRVEQILRDARICRIFEGANGLHATNLAGRLIRIKNGACVTAFEQEIAQAGIENQAWASALGRAGAAWSEATEAVQQKTDSGFTAYAYMDLTGLVALAVAWSRLAAAADQAPNPERTRETADFVMNWMLPEADFLARRIKEGPDNAEISETLFA